MKYYRFLCLKLNLLLYLCCWKRPGAFSRTFKALRDAFLLLPPPCEEPELLLPDLSLPSPPWLALGPSRCWPAPRRRPSWRLSLDIELCWMVGRWENNVRGQRFPVVRVDGKTCQINTWQWGQPNRAGRLLGIRDDWRRGQPIIEPYCGNDVRPCQSRAVQCGSNVGSVFCGWDLKLSAIATMRIEIWLIPQCVKSSADSRKPK